MAGLVRGGLFGQVVLTFIVAVLMGRLVLDRTSGWIWLGLMVPLLLVVITLVGGLLRAVVFTSLFVAVAATTRLLLSTPKLGWSFVVLALLFAASVFLTSRVAAAMWQGRKKTS